MPDHSDKPLICTHWGAYRVEAENGRVRALHGFEQDGDISPIGQGLIDTQDGPTRIKAPAVRRSWLEEGPGSRSDARGAEPLVEVSWERAEQLVAEELERVRSEHGNAAIFAGT